MEVGNINHRELWNVRCQFFRFRLDEHIARKQAVPGSLGDDAGGQAILRVSPGETILYKKVAALQVSQQSPIKCLELC